jgi:DNA/RNA-binding domain of Phe-tRNA-synthetase-like protein
MSQVKNLVSEVIIASAQAEYRAECAMLEATEVSDSAMAALLAACNPEPGKPASEADIEQWKAIAEEWQHAYGTASKCDALASSRAWQRMVRRIGAEKPQSAEALRKAATRAAKSSADKVNPKGNADKDAAPAQPAAPIDGKDAAHSVQAFLSSMEAHLVQLVRSGQFAKAAILVNDMAKAK